MKKSRLLLSLVVAIALVLVATLPALAATPLSSIPKPTTFTVPTGLEMNWNDRHHYQDYEALFNKLNAAYPRLTEMYSIGHTYNERNLWCLEITNEGRKNTNKTGIGVFANIHGGEQESGESALYTAWWLLLNSDSTYVKNMLDNYIIYVVPIINPDGYEQSFVYNNRPNLRPTDRDGDGAPFSDPYTDINGDGFISNVYIGTAEQGEIALNSPRKLTSAGMESANWNKNGKLGDDQRSSTIDLNRTFDYMWNLYNVESYKTPNMDVIGANAWNSAGPAAASEPEVQAVQKFLAQKPMAALTTMHTGIQCVLWPWCYTAPNYNLAPFAHMRDVGTEMAEAYAKTSGRNFYAKSSWEDYPTAAEMI
ncbi:MAG: M14 family zinc carboxypeptidase, partial [Clostridiales bacterium]